MSDLAFLEDFASPAIAAEADTGVDRQLGFADGYAAAQRDFAAAEAAKGGALIDRMTEMSFTYAEARNAVLVALEPLMGEVCDALLPALADQGFGATLAREIAESAGTDIGSFPQVRVHPERVEELRDWTDRLGALDIRVRADPALPRNEAILGEGRESAFDLQPLTKALAEALRDLMRPDAEDLGHG